MRILNENDAVSANLGYTADDVFSDNDSLAALCARSFGAEVLLLLTDVDGVYENFGESNARRIDSTGPEELVALAAEGHFPEGTMGPKVAAAVQFVRATGNRAIICQAADLEAALDGNAGTVIEASAHV